MGQPIPAQHPSVVLRSHFQLVKALLALAMVVVIALTAAVVILANDEDQVSGATTSAKSLESINYGDFNPATGRPDAAPVARQPSQTPGTRYDGGPEEGTRGSAVATSQAPVASRYDGGPEEGTRGPEQVQSQQRADLPRIIPQGPASR
jgi:hypothetical protein